VGVLCSTLYGSVLVNDHPDPECFWSVPNLSGPQTGSTADGMAPSSTAPVTPWSPKQQGVQWWGTFPTPVSTHKLGMEIGNKLLRGREA